MEIVKDKYLKTEFQQYQSLSTKAEKEEHLKQAKTKFKVMSEVEKETIRNAFKDNLVAINNKLKEIDEEIQSYKKQLKFILKMRKKYSC